MVVWATASQGEEFEHEIGCWPATDHLSTRRMGPAGGGGAVMMGEDGTPLLRGTRFSVARRADGLVHIDWERGTRVTLADATEAIAAVEHSDPTRRARLLVDMRHLRGIDHDARRAFAATTVVSRQALLVTSPVSRTVASFFLGVSRPGFPTRVFDQQDQAEAWLRRDG